MVVINGPNSKGPTINLFLHRRGSPSLPEVPLSHSGRYIILALIFLVLCSLLLVIILQFQSRRIDQRLQAVIAAHQPRQTRPRSRLEAPPPCPFIPPSRRPPASFPSVSCRGSIPDSSISDPSTDTDETVPRRTPHLFIGFDSQNPPSACTHPSPVFKYLDEPFSPTSLKSLGSRFYKFNSFQRRTLSNDLVRFKAYIHNEYLTKVESPSFWSTTNR
ncbi:hypothetical protein PTTG_25074 [Puccinia triticina 1-1 BBBD Race 1]|uniref:Uncharacterized protein n=2 Tax=Puccinia triticina TaxID=208348 RepID=A0A180H4C0_PUCT1|nr:uncharacterized protein PtA15_9A377 [Puccinia triticina]OAV99860.1 hypothetical protein PTTG_25074 [Puccinia triticina 1-1 BBBD Race 1]WAQ88250.1 hypothetical protein PtA15_9A377 [Puccinia triticina]